MTEVQNLHYAIGQLAYAVAMADGELQRAERERFEKIIEKELDAKEFGFDVTDIIFQILSKEKIDSNTTYDWAIKTIRTNGHYLSPELKTKFVAVMESVAAAFPPVTKDESGVISRFRKDMEGIIGDPVYYKK